MTDAADPPNPMGVIKGPHLELPKSPCQSLESTWPLKATLFEATFLSFHLRQTSGLTEKLAAAPSVLALAVSTPRPLCWGSRADVCIGGSSCLPRDRLSICLAWDEFPSEPGPLPASPGRAGSCSAPSKSSAAFPLQNNHNHPFLNVHPMRGSTPA